MTTRSLSYLNNLVIRNRIKLLCPWYTSVTKLVVSCRSMSSGRPSVYITRRVPAAGPELLSQTCTIEQWNQDEPVSRDELLKQVKGKDALFCLLTDKIDEDVLKAAGPQLKVVGTMSVGYDHIDLQACKKYNVKVGFTPGVLTNAVAELAVALLLATSRRLKEGMAAVIDGTWGPWLPMWLCGQGLDGATVGIIGLGRIGLAIGKCLKPFGVEKILYVDNFENPRASEIEAERVSQDELLAKSDFILPICTLNDETRGMCNKDFFKKMKKTAILINVSRGPIVNQEDLYEALVSGEICAAGLDVTNPEPLPTNSPLLKLQNCIVLPHIASATDKTRSNMSLLTANNILAALKGEKMPTQVLE